MTEFVVWRRYFPGVRRIGILSSSGGVRMTRHPACWHLGPAGRGSEPTHSHSPKDRVRRFLITAMLTSAIRSPVLACCPNSPPPACGADGYVSLDYTQPACQMLTAMVHSACDPDAGTPYPWDPAVDCQKAFGGCHNAAGAIACSQDFVTCMEAIGDAGTCEALAAIRCQIVCHYSQGTC